MDARTSGKMSVQDRWSSRILSLPVFTRSFSDALLQSPFANIAFVCSMEVGSGAQFADTVAEWSRSLEKEVAARINQEPQQLEQFWSLAQAAEKVFMQSAVTQLGFGLCEPGQTSSGSEPIDQLRKAAAIRSLVQKPLRPPKKLRKTADQHDSTSPLFDLECAEKHKWASRLELIGKRAGEASKLLTDQEKNQELSTGELLKLKQMVLISGAPRTMAKHVRMFERLEIWASSVATDLYPITIEKIIRYALALDGRECGPSVIPSMKTAVKWVAARLAIELPDLDDHRLSSVQQEVVSKRATTLREAIAIPIGVIKSLEKYVVCPDHHEPARIFVWWLLCMVFASLRFDDAVHVRPSELLLKEEGLFGVAWQTKVERKRVGTRFVVPRVGFVNADWFDQGWGLFSDTDYSDRDYWVPELNTKDEFKSAPPTYARTVQWLKHFARLASDTDETLSASVKIVHANQIARLTAHSCRVTLLDAAVHAGRSAQEIGLQANWKDPGPLVLKYTRNRSSVPANMIKQLVRDMVAEMHPVTDDQDTVFIDAEENELDNLGFYVKNTGSGAYEYKFHCSSLSDPSLIACGKLDLSDCVSVGTDLPDISVLCKACARSRPDVVLSHGGSV